MYLVFRSFIVQGFLFGLCLPISVRQADSSKLTVEAVQGEPAILPCHTDHGMPVVWMFQSHRAAPARELSNSGQIINGYNKYFQLDTIAKGDYNLVIKSANYSDAGLYTCDEEDGIGDRHTIIVNVSEADNGIIVTQIGGNASLPCHLTSLSSTVEWRFRPSLTDTGAVVSIDGLNVRGQHIFVIRDARPSDSGVYTCLENDGQQQRERAVRTLQVFVPTTSSTTSSRSATHSTVEYEDPPEHIDKPFVVVPVVSSIFGVLVIVLVILTACLLHRRVASSRRNATEAVKRPTEDVGLSTIPSQKQFRDLGLRQDLNRWLVSDIFNSALDQCPRLYEIFAAEMVSHIRDMNTSVNGIIAMDESDLPSDRLASHIATELNLPLISIKECEIQSENGVQSTRKSLLSAQKLASKFTGNVCKSGQKVVIVGIKGIKDAAQTAIDLAREHDLEIAETICLFKTSAESDDPTYCADWTLFDITSHVCHHNN